jgi:hypothetical protein
MRMREYNLGLNNCFFILKGRILLFYSNIFVLNSAKKFTIVQNGFVSIAESLQLHELVAAQP